MPRHFYEIPPTAGLELHWRDFFGGGGREFDDAAADFLGVENLQLECSGTAALIVALTTLRRHSARRKVIIPAFTCPLVPIAIEHCGLQVCICDLAPGSLDLDAGALTRLCDNDTLAVLPTHLAGRVTAIDAAICLAHRAGAWVIEDAAQAFGASRNGVAVGTEADIGFFSLAVGKGLTMYEGGLLYARDIALRAALRVTSAEIIGVNTRMETLRCLQLVGYALLYNPRGLYWAYGRPRRAALARQDTVAAAGDHFPLRVPLHRVGGWRRTVARNALSRLPDFLSRTRAQAQRRASELNALPGVTVFADREGERGIWPSLLVLMPDRNSRDIVMRELWPSGHGVSRLFSETLADYAYLEPFVPKEEAPNARAIADRSLTISMSHWQSDNSMESISVAIADAARSSAMPRDEPAEER